MEDKKKSNLYKWHNHYNNIFNKIKHNKNKKIRMNKYRLLRYIFRVKINYKKFRNKN